MILLCFLLFIHLSDFTILKDESMWLRYQFPALWTLERVLRRCSVPEVIIAQLGLSTLARVLIITARSKPAKRLLDLNGRLIFDVLLRSSGPLSLLLDTPLLTQVRIVQAAAEET
jgi:hypothetical protein